MASTTVPTCVRQIVAVQHRAGPTWCPHPLTPLRARRGEQTANMRASLTVRCCLEEYPAAASGSPSQRMEKKSGNEDEPRVTSEIPCVVPTFLYPYPWAQPFITARSIVKV